MVPFEIPNTSSELVLRRAAVSLHILGEQFECAFHEMLDHLLGKGSHSCFRAESITTPPWK